MHVLTFGWEFPPYNYGGLGVACEGIIRGLIKHNIGVTLVLPYYHEETIEQCKLICPDRRLKLKGLKLSLTPYHSSSQSHSTLPLTKNIHLYGHNIFQEVENYAQHAYEIAQTEQFDVIHAHDWMSFKAGMVVKKITNKPLIAHIHATEFDRTGGHGAHPEVYALERQGMENADKIIAVSNTTKEMIVRHYGIKPTKIAVVHNATPLHTQAHCVEENYTFYEPMILFLGRLTLQKGPDYFITAAYKALSYRKDLTFVVAGSGDMQYKLMEHAASLGIASNVMFTGFLRGTDLQRIYHMADIYVMPSVSEPFGLVALEAMSNGIPTIISKHAGVTEIIQHCIKVDFWDIDLLANHILSLLEYPHIYKQLAHEGKQEVRHLTWDRAAQKCIDVYREVCHVAYMSRSIKVGRA